MSTVENTEKARVNAFIERLGNKALDVVETLENGSHVWEIPVAADTRYLSHDHFRYIGKFPPQIAHKFIADFSNEGDLVIDPMCGGGTVLVESRLLGRNSLGWDVNPVSMLVARVVSSAISPSILRSALNEFKDAAQQVVAPGSLFAPAKKRPASNFKLADGEEFFSPETRDAIASLMDIIGDVQRQEIKEFILVALLSVVRKVSLANVKKMNVVIDLEKKVAELLPTLFAKLDAMEAINGEMQDLLSDAKVVIEERDATAPLEDRKEFAQLAVVHPPYISNTAFSESTRLQLGILGIQHRNIWKRELRVRGSYVHEPDGLRKYLVGWSRILQNMFTALKPGGYCATVIGDGKIDFVRIPVSPITVEFGKDLGFEVEWVGVHRLNNNTGWTLSHKMKEQHIVVFRKPR